MPKEWHREGATVYTLKEEPGRYHNGQPLMVNDNWFLVQGPDAERVAADIHLLLGIRGKECPFDLHDDPRADVDEKEPCPVCGMLGTPDAEDKCVAPRRQTV